MKKSEIKFRESFERRLTFEIREKFVTNIVAQCEDRGKDIGQHVGELNKEIHWGAFITHAFTWEFTPEYKWNPKFWVRVASEW